MAGEAVGELEDVLDGPVEELVVRFQDQAVIQPADLSLFLRAVLNRCPTPDGQR